MTQHTTRYNADLWINSRVLYVRNSAFCKSCRHCYSGISSFCLEIYCQFCSQRSKNLIVQLAIVACRPRTCGLPAELPAPDITLHCVQELQEQTEDVAFQRATIDSAHLQHCAILITLILLIAILLIYLIIIIIIIITTEWVAVAAVNTFL